MQISTAQGNKDPQNSRMKNNVTEEGHTAQQSIAIYNLNDFLTYFGMHPIENSKQKRNTQSDEPSKLQQHNTNNRNCNCHQALRKQPIQRSPNCVRRFLVKQLQETNENINCLLGCLARNSIKCKCPLPAKIHLNLSGDLDSYGFEKDHSQSSETHVTNDAMYPCSCGVCMYEPKLPSDEASPEFNKRMPVDEPLVYYRIHSSPTDDKLDWKHLTDIQRFLANSHEEFDVDRDDHTTKATRKRNCREASTSVSQSLSRTASSETQNTPT